MCDDDYSKLINDLKCISVCVCADNGYYVFWYVYKMDIQTTGKWSFLVHILIFNYRFVRLVCCKRLLSIAYVASNKRIMNILTDISIINKS